VSAVVVGSAAVVGSTAVAGVAEGDAVTAVAVVDENDVAAVVSAGVVELLVVAVKAVVEIARAGA
jgi:hypothetical protein